MVDLDVRESLLNFKHSRHVPCSKTSDSFHNYMLNELHVQIKWPKHYLQYIWSVKMANLYSQFFFDDDADSCLYKTLSKDPPSKHSWTLKMFWNYFFLHCHSNSISADCCSLRPCLDGRLLEQDHFTKRPGSTWCCHGEKVMHHPEKDGTRHPLTSWRRAPDGIVCTRENQGKWEKGG